MIDNHKFNQWKGRVDNILARITIPWELYLLEDKIFTDKNDNGRLYLQVQFDNANNANSESTSRTFGQKWYLSPHMTTQEIVKMAWSAYREATLHEASEKFRYKDRMIFGPHIDPESLFNVANDVEIRKSDEEKPLELFGNVINYVKRWYNHENDSSQKLERASEERCFYTRWTMEVN